MEKIIGQYWVPGLIDGCFVAGGCSVDYNAASEAGPGGWEAAASPDSDGSGGGSEMVRALLWPGCVVARPVPGMPKATILQWLLDIDYGGWVPRCVLDFVLPFSQVRYIVCSMYVYVCMFIHLDSTYTTYNIILCKYT